jgi:hypothetical protein
MYKYVQAAACRHFLLPAFDETAVVGVDQACSGLFSPTTNRVTWFLTRSFAGRAVYFYSDKWQGASSSLPFHRQTRAGAQAVGSGIWRYLRVRLSCSANVIRRFLRHVPQQQAEQAWPSVSDRLLKPSPLSLTPRC